MQIVVHDTLTMVEPLFTSTEPPKVLLEKAKPLLFEPDGLQPLLGECVGDKEQNGFYVMQAAQQDGFHVLAMQQVWGLFNPTRNQGVSAWQFAQFRQKDVTGTVEKILTDLCELIPDELLPETLTCYLLPTDPANRPLMINNHGVSGFGFAPGYILLQLWPNEGNFKRLPPLLARLLIHNIRPLSAQNSQTLADWLAVEGLAAGFIEMACPDVGETPWLAWLSEPADWAQTLEQIATRYGVERFDDLVVNVYSSMQPIGADRPPPAVAVDADEREYVVGVIRDGLNEVDPNQIAAYLYGDEVVAEQGHTGIGLPPYAGFEAAHQMVQQYLARKCVNLFDAMQDKSTDFTQGM